MSKFDIPAASAKNRTMNVSLWADNVVNEFVKYIKPSKGFLSGEIDVTDDRQKALRDLVVWYDVVHSPQRLKEKMEDLVPEFTIHRSLVGKAKSTELYQSVFGKATELPKTAQMITDLLSVYPG
jgi:hypothetical protein